VKERPQDNKERGREKGTKEEDKRDPGQQEFVDYGRWVREHSGPLNSYKRKGIGETMKIVESKTAEGLWVLLKACGGRKKSAGKIKSSQEAITIINSSATS